MLRCESQAHSLTHATSTLLRCQWVYYCALQGLTLYRIPASLLRVWPIDLAAASAAVEAVGTKTSPADGMTFSDAGILYSGGITDPDNNVWSWEPGSGAVFSQEIFSTNNWWADTFGFDGKGNILWTTNHLNKFFAGTMDFDEPDNFCIKSAFVDAKSYIGQNTGPLPSPLPSASPSALPSFAPTPMHQPPTPTAAPQAREMPSSGGGGGGGGGGPNAGTVVGAVFGSLAAAAVALCAYAAYARPPWAEAIVTMAENLFTKGPTTGVDRYGELGAMSTTTGSPLIADDFN